MQSNIVGKVLTLVIGTCLLVLSIVMLINKSRQLLSFSEIQKDKVLIEAKVTEKEQESWGRTFHNRIIYQFIPNGSSKVQTGDDAVDSTKLYARSNLGSLVKIEYSNSNPNYNRLEASMHTPPRMWGGMLFWLSIGNLCIFMVLSLKIKGVAKKLMAWVGVVSFALLIVIIIAELAYDISRDVFPGQPFMFSSTSVQFRE